MINYTILNGRFCEIRSNRLKSLLKPKDFGFMEKQVLKLDLFETKYLVDNNKIEINNYTKEELKKYYTKQIKNFEEKYLVFKDFRDNGYIVKDGSSFGFDFRIYEKSKDNKHQHTKFLVDVKRTHKDELSKIIKSERLANSIKARYVLAIIDNENKITKIKIERL